MLQHQGQRAGGDLLVRPCRHRELRATGTASLRHSESACDCRWLPPGSCTEGLPHAGGCRDQEARARRRPSDALQRVELRRRGACANAQQRAGHNDRQPHQLRRVRQSALALALITGLSLTCVAEPQRSAAEIMDILMWGREPVGGPFSLIDQTGKTRTDKGFRGKLMLVYFGFTYCPDVCPTDLQNIGLALDMLGEAAELVQPLLITVDPDHDTPEHLKASLQMFTRRLIA